MSYKRIKHKVVAPIDIDGTLIDEINQPIEGCIQFPDPFTEGYILATPKLKNIQILKQWHARGFYIMVWSKRGEEWADAVLRALNLQDHVHVTLNKPFTYLDDLEASEWMGDRVCIQDNK